MARYPVREAWGTLRNVSGGSIKEHRPLRERRGKQRLFVCVRFSRLSRNVKQLSIDEVRRLVVDLSRALTPAPFYAALGWLETSIKTYAKFVDVAAKATSTQDEEQAEVRREQQSIEEVRRLLTQMLEG